MMPNGQPRVSLRQVRHAAASSIEGLNQHAQLLNTRVFPTMYMLEEQLAVTKQQLLATTERLDAFIGRDFRGRLRYLFLGR